VQYDLKGNMINEFLPSKDQITVKIRGGYRYYWHYYTPYIYFCATESGGICFGYNGDYNLYIANPEGKIIQTINVDIKKEKVISGEISLVKKTSPIKGNAKDYYKRMPVPQYRPYFNRILCDEKDRIYVVRIQPVRTRKKYEVVDIFSKKGLLLYRVKMPYAPRIIRNGVIYAVDKSDKEDIKVKKLIIKNYKSMRF